MLQLFYRVFFKMDFKSPVELCELVVIVVILQINHTFTPLERLLQCKVYDIDCFSLRLGFRTQEG